MHVKSAPIKTVLETQIQVLITALSATIITSLVPRPSHWLQAIKIWHKLGGRGAGEDGGGSSSLFSRIDHHYRNREKSRLLWHCLCMHSSCGLGVAIYCLSSWRHIYRSMPKIATQWCVFAAFFWISSQVESVVVQNMMRQFQQGATGNFRGFN